MDDQDHIDLPHEGKKPRPFGGSREEPRRDPVRKVFRSNRRSDAMADALENWW